MRSMIPTWRHLVITLFWVAQLGLAGCAHVPVDGRRPVTHAEQASPATEIGRFAQRVALQPEESGFWALPQAEFALDARLEMIRRAQRSIDLQIYQIGRDGVGLAVLHALRDAAARGVRVRLLVDDFHTLDVDRPLLHLAAHAGAEVRLFNPFMYGRDNAPGRFWNLMFDGNRLNHRMHNKLLVADGAMAVAGGRNLTDEYFMRGTEGNFFDLDFMIVGALLPQLNDLFDRYWNHARSIEIQRVSDDGLSPAQRRQAFASLVRDGSPPSQVEATDMLGNPPLGHAMDEGQPHFRLARARAFADDPDKTFDRTALRDQPQPNTTWAWVVEQARDTRHNSLLVTPYFLPDEPTRQRLQAAARQGVEITVISNSISSSDEPLVAYAARRHRDELLAAGLRLFEINPSPIQGSMLSHGSPPGARLRLHAKLAIFDRRVLGIGSLNMDPRSHRINTELAVLIDSPALAGEVADTLHAWTQTEAVHQLSPSPRGVTYRTRRGASVDETDEEPGLDWWLRWRLQLLYLLVPDELL